MSMKNSNDIIGNRTRDLPTSTNCASGCPEYQAAKYKILQILFTRTATASCENFLSVSELKLVSTQSLVVEDIRCVLLHAVHSPY